MTSVRLDIDGIDEAMGTLEEVKRRLKDLRPALRPAAEEFRAVVDDSFEAQSSPSGERWAPLSPATLRRRRGTSATILVDTGRLRNSLSAVAEAQSLRIGQVRGLAPKYARAHQFGLPARNLPARPFLPFNAAGRVVSGVGPGRAMIRLRKYVTSYVLTGRARA